MVELGAGLLIVENTALIIQNRLSINGSCHGSSMVNLGFNGMDTVGSLTILGDGHIGVFINSHTVAAHFSESVTSAAFIDSLAGVIPILTMGLLRFT